MQENPLCRALKMQDPTLQDSGGPKSNENAEPDNAGPPLSASCSVGQAAKWCLLSFAVSGHESPAGFEKEERLPENKSN